MLFSWFSKVSFVLVGNGTFVFEGFTLLSPCGSDGIGAVHSSAFHQRVKPTRLR